jgi:Ca-activated chloride channel family protein
MTLQLLQPWFLLLLAPAAILLLIGFVLLFTQRRGRKSTAFIFVVRALILAALALALSGVMWLRPSDRAAVAFLVDASDSAGGEAAREFAARYIQEAAAKAGPRDEAVILVFGAEPRVAREAGPARALAAEGDDWAKRLREAAASLPDNLRSGSDLGAALKVGTGLLPEGARKEVVLISDGRDTSGGAAGALAQARAEGLRVSLVRPPELAAPEVWLESVRAPSGVRKKEPFDLQAAVQSRQEGKARLLVYQDHYVINELPLELKPGLNRVTVPNLVPGAGLNHFEVEVMPEADTFTQNNRQTLVVQTGAEIKALFVDRDELQLTGLAEALGGQNISVEVRGANGAPTTLADLNKYDLLVLSDVPALSLSPAQMQLYNRWVRELGGGLLMAGGEESFASGGYFRTPLEDLLPVGLEHEDRQEDPAVALAVVLDRSGSMAATVQGQTKLSLAAQGAGLALEVLGSKDYFGLTAVDTAVYPVVPLARVGDRAAIQKDLQRIAPGGGGIYVYTAIANAYQALQGVQARVKHVILFCDSSDAEEQVASLGHDGAGSGGESSLDLAAGMVANRITTSVVALGYESDSDTPFLQSLAARGSGRFYLTSNALTLPQIFTAETLKVASSSLMEGAFLAERGVPSALTDGIDWTGAPPLLGYNRLRDKAGADVLLRSDVGDPLLATWRRGLGQSAAWASDVKPRWSAEWMSWPGYTQFWAQVVRGLARPLNQGKAELQVTPDFAQARLRVRLEARDDNGAFANGLEPAVLLLAEDGTSQSAAARQDAPGEYLVDFPLPEGSVTLSLSAPGYLDRPLNSAYNPGYAAEYRFQPIDEPWWKERLTATGGALQAAADTVFALPVPSLGTAREPLDLTDAFFILALLLVPVEIALRRRLFRGAA